MLLGGIKIITATITIKPNNDGKNLKLIFPIETTKLFCKGNIFLKNELVLAIAHTTNECLTELFKKTNEQLILFEAADMLIHNGKTLRRIEKISPYQKYGKTKFEIIKIILTKKIAND